MRPFSSLPSKMNIDLMPNNPLHLLDDFLTALPPVDPSAGPSETESRNNDDESPGTSLHEIHHDLTLRVAADLFGHNVTLENALALLEEEEQCQREKMVPRSDGQTPHIIRTVRAKRSGRQMVLIKKARKGKRNSSGGNEQKDSDYYFILLGKVRVDALHQVHRRSMHCTCRSFLNNIKGGGRKSNGGAGDSCLSTSQNIICKHLLAVILMPHLMPWSKSGVNVEVLEDKEFAKLIASCQI
jgi:hypothetical protein